MSSSTFATSSSSELEWVYQHPPMPSHNGGWFTGKAYQADAPWRTFPVTPDVDSIIHHNLRSANPPPGATTQYPGSFRPGNNAQGMPGVHPYGLHNDIMCVSQAPTQAPGTRTQFHQYAYL